MTMLEINQTNRDPLPDSLLDTKSGFDENRATQLSRPRSAEPKVSPPSSASRPQPPAGHTDEGESQAPTPATLGTPKPAPHRRLLWLAGGAIVLAVGAYFLVPAVSTALNTVSTDDAFVNGHYTFVAPRVPGQVKKVLVDDDQRVKKGDLLLQLDPEPYQVQVAAKKAAVGAAKTDLAAAESLARGLEAQGSSLRWKLQHAMEDVNNQIALLRAGAATLEARKASLARARADFGRAEELLPARAVSHQDYDKYREGLLISEAQVKQALETVCQTRVSLGLPAQPPEGHDLTWAPPNLDQTFSSVRQAQADLIQIGAQLGVTVSFGVPPRQMLEEFEKQAPGGDIDRLFAELASHAPAVNQAKARLQQAERDLEQAELNLRYCDIVSEIDGVVTGRNINPGNNVLVGQSLMAVRSITEIWIDANFKETQLADLRIGQRVRCEVDMYGNRREFEGRITGFTMGTGQTLSLLPPQNATGNFVKIVQRLPVRIELIGYDPDEAPLFVGLSVTPYVNFKQPATGQDAGKVLQPMAALPTGFTDTP
jgi:membrane fusion protein (multidrug efflux system)